MKSISLALVVSLLLSSTSYALSEYTLTDLGIGTVSAMNNYGQVIGSNISGAFIYSNGTVQQLNTPGHGQLGWGVTGINDKGQIIGGDGAAFIYSSDSGTTYLASLGGSPSFSIALGINNNGLGTGYSTASNGYNHAVIFNNGIVQDLGTLGGGSSNSHGIALNNKNEVVGDAEVSGSTHAFLFDNGLMQDIGTLGGSRSYARAINDQGQIVGYSDSVNGNSSMHAFLYDNGVMHDLGILDGGASYAQGINNEGQVVGFASTKAAVNHAFFYSQADGFVDLNNLLVDGSSITLNNAVAINDLGQIIVDGSDTSDGNTHAYLLTPTTVPLPASAWLFGSGIIGLIGNGRRKANSNFEPRTTDL